MSFEPEVIPTVPQNEGKSGLRQLTMIGLFAIMFLVGFVIIILFADPFDWNLLQRLNGNYDASAAVMPPDTMVYVGVNLLEANVTRMTEIRDAFVAASAGTEADLNEPIEELDAVLRDELGLNFAEDVQPWLGQFMGIGLLDFTLPSVETAAEPTLNWVAAVEARDTAAADAFLAKLVEQMEMEMGETAVTETYQNISFATFVADDPLSELTLGRAGSMVLMGSGMDAVQQAVDAQNGDSLADVITYQETLAELPTDRLMTVYVDGRQTQKLTEEAMREASPDPASLAAFQQLYNSNGMGGVAMGLSVTEEGIQMDSVSTFDTAQLSELQQLSLGAWVEEPQTAAIASPDTLVYFAGRGLNVMWATMRDVMMLQMSQDEFDESMQIFAEQFGLNPDTDLFPYLDGELAFMVAPSSGSAMAEALDIHLSVTLLAGTSQEAELAAHVETLSAALGNPELGLGVVEKSEVNGLTLYELFSPMEEAVFVYGIGHNYLVLGSEREGLAGLSFAGDGVSLQDSRDFQLVQAAFANEQMPVVYVNVQGLLAEIESGFAAEDAEAFVEVTAVFQPIRYFAATSVVKDDMIHATAILFIETD
ncbi:MAG: DUF3352 domain-containing protein [Ardenticatenaceae bacterium]|nr:DUF3352 domain-containing protein [Ardenticatenaceae bacterium]